MFMNTARCLLAFNYFKFPLFVIGSLSLEEIFLSWKDNQSVSEFLAHWSKKKSCLLQSISHHSALFLELKATLRSDIPYCTFLIFLLLSLVKLEKWRINPPEIGMGGDGEITRQWAEILYIGIFVDTGNEKTYAEERHQKQVLSLFFFLQ